MYTHKQVIIQNALYRTQVRDREQRIALQRLDTLADIPESKIPAYVPPEKVPVSVGMRNFAKKTLKTLLP